jgi:hypothetical protein
MRKARRVRSIPGRVLTAGILAFGSCLAAPSHAVAQDTSKSKLAGFKTLKCVFALYATGTWDNGEARAEVKPASLSVSFDEIDIDSGTARVAEGFGPTDIIAKLSM